MLNDGPGTLDDLYLEWLYKHFAVVGNRNPARSYWGLARQLYTKQFSWIIANDDNRVEDGKDLRQEFLSEVDTSQVYVDRNWMELGCSMLELLVSLAEMAAFESGESVIEWFWRFMYNLGLDRYSDDLYGESIQGEVEEALDRVIRRTYAADGTGGLFPLRSAQQDQRRVELWYQMSAYILEGLYVHIRPRA